MSHRECGGHREEEKLNGLIEVGRHARPRFLSFKRDIATDKHRWDTDESKKIKTVCIPSVLICVYLWQYFS
jgi:hypothetical protein